MKMHKLTAILLLVSLTSFDVVDPTVYICGPKGAKKFHYTDGCRGLSACTHGLFEVPKSKAESFGLTLCGWED